MRLARALGRWVDAFVPDAVRAAGPEPEQRARLLVALTGSISILGPGVLAMVILTENAWLAWALAAACLFWLSMPLVLRATGSLPLAGNLTVLGVFVMLGIGCWDNGGLRAPGLAFAAIVPLAGLAFGGIRSGLAWSAAAVAMLSGLLAVELLHGPRPMTWPDGRTPATAVFGSLTALIAVFLSYAAAFETSKRRTFRSLETANRDLAKARDEAMAADLAKSRFLANMSHEIRTPMNGVLGMASALSRSGLRNEQSAMVSTLEGSARSLLRVLDDVLDYSRIRAGLFDVQIEDFDLPGLLGEVVSLFRPAARQRGVELVMELSPDLPRFILGDAMRVRQILSNLVSNAIKFSSEGGSVGVEATCLLSDTSGTLHVAVTDQGIGIPAARLDAIFDEFQQADASTTRRYGGSGLGLSITRELTELMGGEIGVRSRETEGSCFWIDLPFERAEVVDDGSAAYVPDREALKDLRILLAEDDLVNQQIAVGMLEFLGCRADVVCDGRAAVEAARSGAYDVILMDCHMPELDGFEATRMIRSEMGPRLPVIAVTASVMPEEIELCREAGMDAHLPKPLELEQLEDALQQARESDRS